MIQFKISNPAKLFEKLKTPLYRPESGIFGHLQENGPTSLKTKAREREIKVGSGKIFLPRPLNNADVSLYSDSESYRGQVYLFQPETNLSKNQGENESLIQKVISKLSKQEGVISLGDSLLFMTNGTPTPDFVLSGCDVGVRTLELQFGTGGTRIRKLGIPLEHFEAEMDHLARNLTEITNACYDSPTPDIEYDLKFRDFR